MKISMKFSKFLCCSKKRISRKFKIDSVENYKNMEKVFEQKYYSTTAKSIYKI